METAQWPPKGAERRVRPHKEKALNCPRCKSANTKFCYYNNYSLSQPRYFCKSCRRYWTEGGTLRNVPVGGGSRKKKRFNSSSSSSSSLASSSITKVDAINASSKSTSSNLQPPKPIPHEIILSSFSLSSAFPFEDLKQVTIGNASDEIMEGVEYPTFFWEGIMGNNGEGGGW